MEGVLQLRTYIEKLINKEDLSTEDIKQAMNHCFESTITDTEIAAFLTALRAKGETAEEIAGIAEVIQSHSELSSISLNNVMDNCGTGGDRSNSFNISTTASFVIAGAGIKVAKHGNRSISSRTGSADLLEHLGVSLSFSKETTEQLLRDNNISFLFAPYVHKKLRPFMKVRQELGLPTVFNLIGPLTNPISLESQLVGVYRRDMLETVAKALKQLGRKRAIVLNGAGYMDEASLAGDNALTLLENSKITSFMLHPEDVGLPVFSNDKIRGGDAKENANILRSVLNNEDTPYLHTVLLNAGIAIYANGKANSIKDGIEIARNSIESGAALKRLNYLITFSENAEKEQVN